MSICVGYFTYEEQFDASKTHGLAPREDLENKTQIKIGKQKLKLTITSDSQLKL